MPSRTNPSYNKIFPIFCYSLIASTVVLILSSYYTSPLDFFWRGDGMDSSIFRIVGLSWTEGRLPYVDTWDLKGPFIFLINSLGYIITSGGVLGIFMFQVVALATTLTILYVWTFKIFSSFLQTILSCFLSILLFLTVYEGGNCVEEFCLPFLSLSFYLIYKWLEKVEHEEVTHPLSYAFIYGITFGVCAMTRLTNAIPLCGGVAVIGLFLLLRQQYKSTCYNLLAMIGGTLVVIIPFIIYFAFHNAVGELWYGTIGYNLDYIGVPSSPMNSFQMLIAFVRPITNASYLLILLSLVLFFLPSKRLTALTMAGIGIPSFLLFANSNGYAHYAIIMIAALPFIYAGIKSLWSSFQNKYKLWGTLFTLIFVGLLLYPIKGLWHSPLINQITQSTAKNDDTREENKVVDFIQRNIPTEEKDLVIFYGLQPNVYLHTNILPCYPYFVLQEAEAEKSVSLQKRIKETFATCKAKYIVSDSNTTLIQTTLSQHYHPAKVLNLTSDTSITLYIRNT